jgi:hypothetical protein
MTDWKRNEDNASLPQVLSKCEHYLMYLLIVQCASLRAPLFPTPLTEAIVLLEGSISFAASLVNPLMLLCYFHYYPTLPTSQRHAECLSVWEFSTGD